MKRAKKGFEVSYIKIIVYMIIIVLLIGAFYNFVGFTKNCKQDRNCFDKRIADCKKAKFVNIDNNNIYDYHIKGKSQGNCILDISLRRMAIGTDMGIVKLLEGKSMRCLLPADKVRSLKLDEMENLVNFCSGSLKEGMLELALERMYGLIVQNLGGLVGEIRKGIFNI